MNSTTKCYIVKNDYPMLSTQIYSYVENHKFNYYIIVLETQNIENNLEYTIIYRIQLTQT